MTATMEVRYTIRKRLYAANITLPTRYVDKLCKVSPDISDMVLWCLERGAAVSWVNVNGLGSEDRTRLYMATRMNLLIESDGHYSISLAGWGGV